MPSQVDKLKAHAEHLLDHYLRLRGIYAILEPLFFDEDLVARVHSGRRAQGASILTTALVYSYILGVANIAGDKDPRTPSLRKLVEALSQPDVVRELRTSCAQPAFVDLPDADIAVLDAYREIEQREGERRGARFDAAVTELRVRWAAFESSAALKSCSTMRDQMIAHHQLWHEEGRYRPLDVSALQLKVNDLSVVLKELEACVLFVGTIYRSGDFDFERLDAQLSAASKAFWSPEGAV